MKILRSNTIVYCSRWEETVRFYADSLGLPVLTRKDWFVEFKLAGDAALSVADERGASISSAGGNGITISLRVEDLESIHAALMAAGHNPGPLCSSWGSPAFFIHDPEGNRLELWS